MRLLFAHDHVFQSKGQGEYFSPGRLPYQAWQRYLGVFSDVLVLAREIHVDCLAVELDRADGPGVSFDDSHGYAGPADLILRRNQLAQHIGAAVDGVDAVVARLPSELGLLAVDHAKRTQKPYAVEIVACARDSYRYHGGVLARLYAPIAAWRMRRAVWQAPYAIYVTQKFLQHRYPCQGKTAAASNVDIGTLEEGVLARRLRRIKAMSDDLVLGFIGSLHADYKGLDTALRALAWLHERGVSATLQVLGDGDPLRWKVRAEKYGIHDVVQFVGVRKRGAQVFQWLDGIDIYLHPSKTEGLPRAVIEAMSRGCPVVASRVGGLPELVEPEFLCVPSNWRQLAELIVCMIRDRNRMCDCARRNWSASKEFESPVLERKLAEFWMEFGLHVAVCQTTK